MATPTGLDLVDAKEPRALLSNTGCNSLEANELCAAINATNGWYAKVVPAWQTGLPPLSKLYWVKCCRMRHGPVSKWYHLASETQWREVKAIVEQQHDSAKSASVEPSTCSVTEE